MPEETTKKENKKVTTEESHTTKTPNNSNNNDNRSNNAAKDIGKVIAISILATTLCCFIITFAILALTGTINFNGSNTATPETNTTGTGSSSNGGGTSTNPPSTTPDDGIIDNPNPRVRVNGFLAEAEELEFYLPDEFEAGGKNKDGAYTFNLTDDDGWAQVVVYVEDTSLSPSSYLLKKSPYLDITDDDYEMNGTEWVQGENGSMLAYATKLDGKVYAIIYSVKLDSDATSEAMSMIPKTLYMKRIYQDQ